MKDIQHFMPGKNNFDGFIARLSKFQKLFASVAKGYNNYAFEEVTADGQISPKLRPHCPSPEKVCYAAAGNSHGTRFQQGARRTGREPPNYEDPLPIVSNDYGNQKCHSCLKLPGSSLSLYGE